MSAMIDLRLRTVIPDDELQDKVGRLLTDEDYNVLVTRDTLIRKPDGSPLAIYRRGAIPAELREQAYPVLHELRNARTSNRGTASGTKRVSGGSGKRSYSREVPSAIVGAFDPAGPRQFCRLTAFTGEETEKMRQLHPLLRWIGGRMRAEVPERYEAQMRKVRATDPAWLIPGTPFTTVTVNNTWPTAVHKDQGDLDEGFSNLAVWRRGSYTGGVFVFPRYRVGFDLQDGDLILMDAHEWHGNTPILCSICLEQLNGYHDCPIEWDTTVDLGQGITTGPAHAIAERVSVVAYYRTRMSECGTPEDEAAKQRQYAEQRASAAVGE